MWFMSQLGLFVVLDSAVRLVRQWIPHRLPATATHVDPRWGMVLSPLPACKLYVCLKNGGTNPEPDIISCLNLLEIFWRGKIKWSWIVLNPARFYFSVLFFSLSLEAAVWQTRGTASEPRQCTEEKRAVGAKVKQATPGKTPLKSSKQRQVCLSRLAFCRRERLVYVGISVENIIPVSRSQRLKSHSWISWNVSFFFSRSPCKKYRVL